MTKHRFNTGAFGRAIIWCAALSMGAVAVTGCSEEPERDTRSRLGEECTIGADCVDDLLCISQVCTERAPTNNDRPDGGGDGNNDTDVDVPVPIEPEDYIISYHLETSFPERSFNLHLFSTADGDLGRLNPPDINCDSPQVCLVSDDLTKFISTQTNAADDRASDVYVGPVSSTLEVSERGELFVESVRQLRTVGDYITYSRNEGGNLRAYYKKLDGSPEQFIADFGGGEGTQGSWFLAPHANLVVVYRHGLASMGVEIGTMGEPLEQVYSLNAGNFGTGVGSFFGGTVDTAISRDGQHMAFITDAPNSYNRCEPNDSYNSEQCTRPGHKCGAFGRCTAIEVTVHFIDLTRKDNLGTSCDNVDACGPVHKCDAPSPTEFEDAKCIPGFVAFGLPRTPNQGSPPVIGCEHTSISDEAPYTTVRGPLNFGPEGMVYTVAGRDCGEQNIQKTDIIRINPRERLFDVVYGNPGEDFDANRCYNSDERAVDVTNCIIHVRQALVSPGGNEVAFVGTHPEILDASLAGNFVDLWSVRRDGLQYKWIGGHRQSETVRTFRVHAMP